MCTEDGGPDIPRKWLILGVISWLVVKDRGCAACGQYMQTYSIGGSSDASFRRHYWSNLFQLGVNEALINDR